MTRSIEEHEAVRRAHRARTVAGIVAVVITALALGAFATCADSHRPQYAAVTR
ncbi:hypothetical protein BH11GEM2_BH11GEM2_40430 [soil metagenome]